MSPEDKIRNDIQDLAKYILGLDLELDPNSKERLINILLGHFQRVYGLPYSLPSHNKYRIHLAQYSDAVSAYCMAKETQGVKGYLANARTYLIQAQKIMEI